MIIRNAPPSRRHPLPHTGEPPARRLSFMRSVAHGLRQALPAVLGPSYLSAPTPTPAPADETAMNSPCL